MAQYNPKNDVKSLRIIMAAALVMLLWLWIPEVISIIRIFDAKSGVDQKIYASSGRVEYVWDKKNRSPVIELRRAGDGGLEFSCPSRAFKAFYVCPPSDESWSGRSVDIQWIDVPRGGAGDVVHRAIDIQQVGGALFKSTPHKIYAAELSMSVYRMIIAFCIMAPIWLIFYFVSKVLQSKQ